MTSSKARMILMIEANKYIDNIIIRVFMRAE